MAKEITKKEMEAILKERISTWREQVKAEESEYNVTMLSGYCGAYTYVRLNNKSQIKNHFTALRITFKEIATEYPEPINLAKYAIFNYLCIKFGYDVR